MASAYDGMDQHNDAERGHSRRYRSRATFSCFSARRDTKEDDGLESKDNPLDKTGTNTRNSKILGCIPIRKKPIQMARTSPWRISKEFISPNFQWMTKRFYYESFIRRSEWQEKEMTNETMVTRQVFSLKKRFSSNPFQTTYVAHLRENPKRLFLLIKSPGPMIEEDKKKMIDHYRCLLKFKGHAFFLDPMLGYRTHSSHTIVCRYEGYFTLEDIMTLKSPMTAFDARFYICELVSGLGYLHEHQVIHRNVDTTSVLVASDGHVVITDFSIASLTQISSVQYWSQLRVDFMAPEMIQLPPKEYDKAVDWWAVGVVLYCLLERRGPFEGDSKQEVLQKIQKANISFVRDVPQDMYALEAKAFCKALLNRNARNRLGSGEHGTMDIKEDEYFEDIPWETVDKKSLLPPFLPPAENWHLCAASLRGSSTSVEAEHGFHVSDDSSSSLSESAMGRDSGTIEKAEDLDFLGRIPGQDYDFKSASQSKSGLNVPRTSTYPPRSQRGSDDSRSSDLPAGRPSKPNVVRSFTKRINRS